MAFVATTSYNSGKPFSFSYSKLKNFETCPKRYYNYDVAKTVKEPEGEALLWGNTLHKAFAEHVEKGAALPESMQAYQPLLDRLKAYPGDTLVEQQLAITKNFAPCEWFSRQAWYRGIGDIIKVYGEFAYAGDYKTGKVKEESTQLGLLATCIFAHYPQVQAIRTEFLWLAEDAVTRADFKRTDMASFWAGVLPQVRALQNAHEASEFPARPGGLCRKWCAVTSCVHNGANG